MNLYITSQHPLLGTDTHYKDFSVVIRTCERNAQNVDFVEAIKKEKK